MDDIQQDKPKKRFVVIDNENGDCSDVIEGKKALRNHVSDLVDGESDSWSLERRLERITVYQVIGNAIDIEGEISTKIRIL